MKDINSKSRKMKRILAWDLYETYEEDGKDYDFNWYLCTFCCSKKHYKIKEGMIGMILYNKSNTSSFRNHVVTDHKRIFHALFFTYMGNQLLWLVMMPPPLSELCRHLYHVLK